MEQNDKKNTENIVDQYNSIFGTNNYVCHDNYGYSIKCMALDHILLNLCLLIYMGCDSPKANIEGRYDKDLVKWCFKKIDDEIVFYPIYIEDFSEVLNKCDGYLDDDENFQYYKNYERDNYVKENEIDIPVQFLFGVVTRNRGVKGVNYLTKILCCVSSDVFNDFKNQISTQLKNYIGIDKEEIEDSFELIKFEIDIMESEIKIVKLENKIKQSKQRIENTNSKSEKDIKKIERLKSEIEKYQFEITKLESEIKSKKLENTNLFDLFIGTANKIKAVFHTDYKEPEDFGNEVKRSLDSFFKKIKIDL